MAHYELSLPYLAAVAVGHRVALEYYVRDVGIFGTKVELDRNAPTLVDLETGIRWQGDVATLNDPHRALHQTYYARVLYCVITTSGGDLTHLNTRLSLDPMEPPGAYGPYRGT